MQQWHLLKTISRTWHHYFHLMAQSGLIITRKWTGQPLLQQTNCCLIEKPKCPCSMNALYPTQPMKKTRHYYIWLIFIMLKLTVTLKSLHKIWYNSIPELRLTGVIWKSVQFIGFDKKNKKLLLCRPAVLSWGSRGSQGGLLASKSRLDKMLRACV